MVFNEGASRWVAADNVPGLFPAPVPCSSPGKYPEALPAQKPSSAPKPLDVILGMGVVLSIPFCCLGEFIVRPFLILAGLIWVIVGMRAVATGTISDSNGRLYCHPYYYRIVGAMVLLIGLFFFIGNLIDLCTSR